jgi:E3 ubiquitin-protein ligase Topors
VDEAEGFLLEHALISPPRTWPPLPTTQADRIAAGRKKMDWEGEVRDNPDDPTTMHHAHDHGEGDEENKERCVICLMALRDRTVVGVCGHEFCVCPSNYLPSNMNNAREAGRGHCGA